MKRASQFEDNFQEILQDMYQEPNKRRSIALKSKVFVNVHKQQEVLFERGVIQSLNAFYRPAEELEEMKIKAQVMSYLKRDRFDWSRDLIVFSFGFFKKLTAVTLAVALLSVSQGLVSPVTLETSFASEMKLRIHEGVVFVNGSPVDYDVNLKPGDLVRTFDGGNAEIVKTKGDFLTSLVRLSGDTYLKITVTNEDNSRIELSSGRIWALSSGQESMDIVTSNKDRSLPNREGSVVTSVGQGQVSIEDNGKAVKIQPENKVNVKVVRFQNKTVENTDVFTGEFVMIPHSSLNKSISKVVNRDDEWVRENQVKDMVLLGKNQEDSIDSHLEVAGNLPGTASDAFGKLAHSVQKVMTLSLDEKISQNIVLFQEQFAEVVVLSDRLESIDIKSLSSYEKTFSSTLDLLSASIPEVKISLRQQFLSILEKQFLSLSQVSFGEPLYGLKLQVEQHTLTAYDKFEYSVDALQVAHNIVQGRLFEAAKALRMNDFVLSEEMMYEALSFADNLTSRIEKIENVSDMNLVLNLLTERLSMLSQLEVSASLKIPVQRMKKQTVVLIEDLSAVMTAVQPNLLSKTVSGVVLDFPNVELGLSKRVFGLAP